MFIYTNQVERLHINNFDPRSEPSRNRDPELEKLSQKL